MKAKIQQFFSGRSVRHGGGAVAIVALVLALFYLVNLIVLGAANRFSWYFYTAPQYDMSISGAGDGLLGDINTAAGKVKVVFCDNEETIKTHKQLDYVYKTAVGMAERYPDLIDLQFVNMWLEPARVAPYRTAEDGSENALSNSTVIFDYNGKFVLNSAAAFYTLDENDYVTAYNGEEIFIANILWVTAAEHPIAYFTANHGEQIPAPLYRQLTAAGYRVERLDLSAVKAVPEDAGLVVISAPVYDFQKAAATSSYVAELTKLENYLANGGRMYVALNPDYTEKLPRLTAFLAEYGIGVESGVLVDRETALPGSGGFTLITSYADTAGGALLQAATGEHRTVLSYAAPLSLSETALATVEPLLYSASSANRLVGGQESAGGALPLLALSRMKTGDGMLLVSGSAYLADATAVNGPGYGNKEAVNACLSLLGAERVPSGIPAVQIDRTAIENLTLGEVDTYALFAVLLIPAAILTGGLILCRRRKNY